MPKKFVEKKPPVGEGEWYSIYQNNRVELFASGSYLDFYKVRVAGERPKYFFGETAWMNAARITHDHAHYHEWEAISSAIQRNE
jgi:hypothetical protein